MTKLTPWFSRTFPFPVAIELIPNISSRLRGTPARLESLLKNVESGVLTTKPQDQWSIQEHVGHMLDIEPLWLARVEDYAKGSPKLTPTDLQNKKTDEAHHNARSLIEILAGFSSARAILLDRIDQSDLFKLTGTIPHPRLRTPMGITDHLYFVAEHDDHHLAIIYSLLVPHPL